MAKGRLWIGWSRGDITPLRKTFVAGQFHRRISDQVLSPLTATALALEVRGDSGIPSADASNAEGQAVMLSCDLAIEAFKPELVRALEGRCPGLDLTKLTVNATHTHNAPAMQSGIYEEPEDDPDFMKPEEYRDWLVVQLADIVEAAWKGRKPGGLSRGFGYAVVGRCRRATYADGTALMYGETDREDFLGFESCDDHAVNLLFTRDEADELTGILVNLACTSQASERLGAFSADFWHNVREGISERYGPAVHLLPQAAWAGDMSPHLLSDQKEERDLRDRLGVDDCGIIGRRIMAAVDEAMATASPTEETVELVHAVHHFLVPKLMVTKEQYELEKRVHEMSEEERARQPFGFQRIWPFGLVTDLIARYEQQEANPEFDVECHVIRLGDVVFATNPLEPFVDYGMRIRCRSRALQTFLVQLADAYGEGAYIPTQRALDGGHYSAVIKSAWFGPEGGAVLVEETVHAINALFADADYPRTR
jgi:hypothetical protein